MRFPYVVLLSACALTLALPLLAQSPNGVINGLVADPSDRVVVAADVVVANDVTGLKYATKTNNEGIYVLPNLPPGSYRLQVSKVGFKTLIKPDIVLNVQDALSINFTLPIGAFHETITVEGGAPLVNTENATVSTVVDRQFAENLPMNGRSFQSLIELTPGVVLTTSNSSDGGQFSINGQRASSNYWMVDGVSANIGIGASPSPFSLPGNGLAGALGSFSAMGGTNSLVSVDAMQEFRIQTSTYAPEFGRTPGGQISIVTRSGTNRFHGTAFDYLRNDVFDASNWFNGYTNNPPLPKAKERQNDFGGTLGGPIFKDRTFFFFSYEGLRLRLPETELTTVPDAAARSFAIPAMQPYLNAFPMPNGPDNAVAGTAQFDASYSNPSGLDAYSIRLDHKLTDKVNVFGRYNYSPSSIAQRGQAPFYSLSTVSSTQIVTQTATLGTMWAFSSALANDFRFNYSRTSGKSSGSLDDFGGAVPPTSLSFPTPFTSGNSLLNIDIFSLQNGSLAAGPFGRNVQRQLNFIDSLSWQKGAHSLKFGADFRRLSPINEPNAYEQIAYMADVPNAENGNLIESVVGTNLPATLLFRNLGVYAQDTWRTTPRLTLTYGIRWDVDFVPRSLDGPSLPAVTGFNLNNFSSLALAPAGTAPYQTSYDALAPRVGVAYLLAQSRDWQTVLRGGFGVFYDLATSEVGNNIGTGTYPFGSTGFTPGGTFPLNPASAEPPPITPASLSSGILLALDPRLKQPYTLEWNAAVEQGLGSQQAVSVSYIGAAGKRLIQTAFIAAPTPSLEGADLVANVGTSSYNALQLQFQRRMSHGLQLLASYTWSHSIDTGSAGSTAVVSNSLIPSAISANRAASGFDIRNALSAGLTYDVPAPKAGPLLDALIRGWSTENVVLARSAPPVDISDVLLGEFDGGVIGDTRPDFVPGTPVYLYGSTYPGGKAFNPAAFTSPPIDPTTGLALRQGDVPRNFLRGFGAAQWDFAVHRTLSIHEPVKLQFRAEMFNVLNHPNFGQPSGAFGVSGFGLSNQMLAQSLSNNNLGGGGFSPLYQIGGPRSIQLALKLEF
ncbi:MAG TPA: TonB-dependent receptor [Terriglobales bacterium]|nr:TonB-dependent receptor [Terriglobales bacterium]